MFLACDGKRRGDPDGLLPSLVSVLFLVCDRRRRGVPNAIDVELIKNHRFSGFFILQSSFHGRI